MAVSYNVDDSQMRLHLLGEAAGLLVAGPFLLYVVQTERLEPRTKTMLVTLGLGTIAIDGWLLGRNLVRVSR